MHRFKLLVIFLLFFTSSLYINAQTPADSAQIYLITASSGEETYTAFGHSAIRVYDPTRNYDVVYNFGTFDFSTSNFYVKFAFGRLMYFLSKKHYEQFLYEYRYFGQALYLQKLNLTNTEKWQLISNLENTYNSQDRYYRYDFFYDNCATRIRDVIEKSVNGVILYDSTYITQIQTFRQLIDPDLGRTPWTFFGINILLGQGTDSIAKLRDYMFLPAHLENILSKTKVIRGDSLSLLTGLPVELFPTTLVFTEPPAIMSPEIIMGVIFILILLVSIWFYKKNISLRWFDFILFMVTGLLGLLITALTIWSKHGELHTNYNLFWSNPLSLLIAVGLLFARQKKWVHYLKLGYIILLIIFIPVSFIVMQEFSPAVYPVVCILMIRTIPDLNIIRK